MKRHATPELDRRAWDAFLGRRRAHATSSPDLSKVHCVVYHTTAKRLRTAIDQVGHDAGDKMPVVVWRSKRGTWVAMLTADDLLALLPSVPPLPPLPYDLYAMNG